MTAVSPVARLGIVVVGCFLSGLLIVSTLTAVASAASFETLDNTGGGSLFASAISADGSVVVGVEDTGSGRKAFRWTQAGGAVGLTGLVGNSVANAVNADGSVVVGYASTASGEKAFRWTAASGMVALEDLTGYFSASNAKAVNSDGSIVVGGGVSPFGTEAFRWTSAGEMSPLGDLEGGNYFSEAFGVSADGAVVVGYSNSASGDTGFRWTQAGGMLPLGDPEGNFGHYYAWAVSSDGSVVVGEGDTASGDRAFRWTEAGGMVVLEDPTGYFSTSKAKAVSSDGSVIVGLGRTASGMSALRWTDDAGVQSLKEVLDSNGVDMTGWELFDARGVSADGTTIVGTGSDSSGLNLYIARLNGVSGVISADELNTSLGDMGQVGYTATAMAKASASAMMDVSHGAVLNTASGLSSGDEMTGKTQLWVVGTLVGDSSFSGDDLGGEGGVGLTHYLANGLSFGGGVFTGKRSLDTSYGGNQKTTLIGPGVFVAYAPEADGLRIEGGGTWHYIDMNLKRGYQNGAGSAQSRGNTEGYAFGLYGRLGWVFPVADRFALQPFVQYNWQHVEIDGYSESGGPFPASFDDRTDTINRARLGLEAQYAYSESLDLWAWGAWSHRFETKSSSMSGQLTGLYAFNYGGGAIDQNWGDAGVGAKWCPYEGFETFSRLGFGIDSQHNAEPDLALTIGLGWDI